MTTLSRTYRNTEIVAITNEYGELVDAGQFEISKR
jgi:hypothetical protein